jgi:tetratricopeptide (TPR) repeat protein
MGVLSIRREARWLSRLLFVLLLCGAAAFAGVHLYAWHHYRAAQRALDHYHFAQARNHLAVSLRAWPNWWRVHLLAARAARLDGAAEEAKEHLHACQQEQANTEEFFLEWALLRAQFGELDAVEGYLLDRLRRSAERAPLIQGALIEGYLRTYRIGPALAAVEYWLTRQPEDTQALYLQGSIWLQVERPQTARTSFRRVLELDPQRDDARWRLTQCLLKMSLYEEANSHLEYLHRRYPQNTDMTVELAGVRFKQGQLTEARQMLDAVLAEHPDDEAALRECGRLDLVAGKVAEAEKCLRRAAQLNPRDPQLFQLLSTALEHQGKQDEAQLLQDRLKQSDRDFARLSAICLHELGQRPNDPVLLSELGALLLRLGYRQAGRNWLLLALQEDPDCAAARAALEGASQNASSPTGQSARP